MSPLPVTYTTEEVAKALRVTPTALGRLVKAGKVTPMRLSDRPRSPMRWTDSDLRQLEQALRPAEQVAPPGRRRRRRAA